MACIQTPRTLGRLENISNVLDCYTEASMVGGKSYCRERTRNQSRFISFVPDMVAEVEEQEESLEAVVGAQWQVHKVSPLWNIPYKGAGTMEDREEGMGSCQNVRRLVVGGEQGQEEVYDEKGLSRQARSIAEVIGSHADVTITTLAGLRGSRFDREALSILVLQKMSGKRVEIFQGILCSVEAEEVVMSHSRRVTNLPVLLTRGTVEVTEKVVLGMERCWDCVIGKLQLPPRELQWMMAMWAGLGPCPRPALGDLTNTKEVEDGLGGKQQQGTVKLVYGLPDSLAKYRDQINRFTFEFGAREIREIWKASRVEGGNCLSQAEMESFHLSIAQHIKSTLGVCTEKLELVQIQLPFLKAHSGGRLAIGQVDRVKTVLRLLTELCQPLLEVNPTLAVGTGEEADTISMDYTVTREAN